MLRFVEILETVLVGNTVREYLSTALIFLTGLTAVVLLKRLVLARVRKLWRGQEIPDVWWFYLRLFEERILPVALVALFYGSFQYLEMSPSVEKALFSFSLVTGTFLLVRVCLEVIRYWMEAEDRKKQGSPQILSRKILTILKVIIWGMALVFVLGNLGFNVSAMMAGLGIGGVAAALAVQNILGDVFNYFVVLLDKPFEIGDFIIVGDDKGIVEHIGVKSTRVRSLGGEQLVFSNSDLISSRIRNYKRMNERRVLFSIGVTYQTTLEKMKKAPAMIRSIIESVPDTRFDRAHFKEFGDFSLVIEVVYYVLNADYNKYMDIQQTLNLKIMETFAQSGMEFAYPTQTLYLNSLKA